MKNFLCQQSTKTICVCILFLFLFMMMIFYILQKHHTTEELKVKIWQTTHLFDLTHDSSESWFYRLTPLITLQSVKSFLKESTIKQDRSVLAIFHIIFGQKMACNASKTPLIRHLTVSDPNYQWKFWTSNFFISRTVMTFKGVT